METESNAIAHLDFTYQVTCGISEMDARNAECSSEPRWLVHAPCSATCTMDKLLLCSEHAEMLEEYLTSSPKILQCKECTQVYSGSSVTFAMLP